MSPNTATGPRPTPWSSRPCSGCGSGAGADASRKVSALRSRTLLAASRVLSTVVEQVAVGPAPLGSGRGDRGSASCHASPVGLASTTATGPAGRAIGSAWGSFLATARAGFPVSTGEPATSWLRARTTQEKMSTREVLGLDRIKRRAAATAVPTGLTTGFRVSFD